MNAKQFSDAMSELDIRYVDEALNYRPVEQKSMLKKRSWMKWAVAAACLVLVCVAGSIFLAVSFTDENGDIVTRPGIGDAAPMVFVNDTLYKQSVNQTAYEAMKDDFIYLGKIESDVHNDQSTSDGVPKENFQANHPIIGAEIYQYGKDIVVHINDKYWLYEAVSEENGSDGREGLSEEEKMMLDPSYKAD